LALAIDSKRKERSVLERLDLSTLLTKRGAKIGMDLWLSKGKFKNPFVLRPLTSPMDITLRTDVRAELRAKSQMK